MTYPAPRAASPLMAGYLRRLGMDVEPEPTWPALCDLVQRHMITVPFENLDIVNRLPGELGTEAALHKVVVRGRGGFCYELNEAFRALLEYLGFRTRRIEARVWLEPRREFGAPFDHLALIVSLPEGEYLTDVGFGDNNRTPMRLPSDRVTDLSGHYTLEQTSAELWQVSRADRPLYQLSTAERPLSAFAAMHRHHQTSADSIFTQHLICTRATPTGRITFSRSRLIVMDGGSRSETTAERDQALTRYFGLIEESAAC